MSLHRAPLRPPGMPMTHYFLFYFSSTCRYETALAGAQPPWYSPFGKACMMLFINAYRTHLASIMIAISKRSPVWTPTHYDVWVCKFARVLGGEAESKFRYNEFTLSPSLFDSKFRGWAHVAPCWNHGLSERTWWMMSTICWLGRLFDGEAMTLGYCRLLQSWKTPCLLSANKSWEKKPKEPES